MTGVTWYSYAEGNEQQVNALGLKGLTEGLFHDWLQCVGGSSDSGSLFI